MAISNWLGALGASIAYLKPITDARMQREVRFPASYLLLDVVLGILNRCQSLRALERFAIRHHSILTVGLGIELRRPPTDSSFRYFFLKIDVAAQSASIYDMIIDQILSGVGDLDQLVCDGNTLRGSTEPTACVGSAFIPQAFRCLGRGVQASQSTGDNHERAVLR